VKNINITIYGGVMCVTVCDVTWSGVCESRVVGDILGPESVGLVGD
jgi:hypothetical protein